MMNLEKTHTEKTFETASQTLTKAETARLLKVSVRTLDRWRAEGRGIPFLDLSIGKSKKPIIRYRLVDIERFIEKTRCSPVNVPNS